VHAGLTLPVICSTGKKRWNFQKANWDRLSASTEKSIPIISWNSIPVDEAYSRFTRAMSKAAHSTIPRGVCTVYVPCMDEESQALLAEYENMRSDIADHLTESLGPARHARWEESTSRMNFTYSSRKSCALLRCVGAAQCPPQSARPPVSANSGISSCPGRQSASK